MRHNVRRAIGFRKFRQCSEGSDALNDSDIFDLAKEYDVQKLIRKIMTVPVIDGIDHNTWEYRPVYEKDNFFRGIFKWGMLYKEIEITARKKRKRTYKSEPYKSPTHAGLFAMDRNYFLELGAYDPGLLVWGKCLSD